MGDETMIPCMRCGKPGHHEVSCPAPYEEWREHIEEVRRRAEDAERQRDEAAANMRRFQSAGEKDEVRANMALAKLAIARASLDGIKTALEAHGETFKKTIAMINEVLELSKDDVLEFLDEDRSEDAFKKLKSQIAVITKMIRGEKDEADGNKTRPE